MEWKNIWAMLAIISLITIFFMPKDSKSWVGISILAIIFGIIWVLQK